jgi:hypothetical protein
MSVHDVRFMTVFAITKRLNDLEAEVERLRTENEYLQRRLEARRIPEPRRSANFPRH